MKKTSKRFSEIKSKTQDAKLNLDEAVKLLKECANAKFDEAIEFHIKTNADPKHADQQIRQTSDLPSGTGKTVRILLFYCVILPCRLRWICCYAIRSLAL